MPYVYYFYEPFEPPASLFERLAAYQTDDTSIRVLGLSKRGYNALRRAKLTTIGQVAQLTPAKLRELDAIGCKLWAEIEEGLAQYITTYPPPRSESPSLAGTFPAAASHEAFDSWQQAFHLLRTDPTEIEVLALSRRTAAFLQNARLTTVGAVASLKREELAQVRHLGKVAINEIERKLKAYLAENLPRLQAASTEQEVTTLTRNPEIERALLDNLLRVPLAKISISRLGLSKKQEEALKSQGIESIHHLLQPGAYFAANFEIRQALDDYLAWLTQSEFDLWDDEIHEIGISPLDKLKLSQLTLEELAYQWLSILTEKQHEVIKLRFGLGNHPPLTLEKTGEQVGLKRERVRQLEKNALDTLNLSTQRKRLQPLVASLTWVISHAGGLLSEEELSHLVEAGALMIQPGHLHWMRFFALFCRVETQFQYDKKSHWITMASTPFPVIREVHKSLAKVLKQKSMPTSVETLLEEFKQTPFYLTSSDELTDDFILACLRLHPALKERAQMVGFKRLDKA